MSDFKGIGVALVTPLANGKVDFNAIDRLLSHLSEYVDYYVVMGTTGESATLEIDEKIAVLHYIVERRANKPVVYGIGGNNTSKVIEEIKRTDLTNVDALLSVSPYYIKPPQTGIIRHYEAIADVSTAPIILYNVPGRTGSNIAADSTVVLSQHQNIIGIKEASGDLAQCERIVNESPDDFLLISGDDLMTPEILKLGGTGVISVLANGIPELFREFYNADYTKALDFKSKLLNINNLMYAEGNPVGIKELLSQKGICNNEVRLPLVKASESLSNAIREAQNEL